MAVLIGGKKQRDESSYTPSVEVQQIHGYRLPLVSKLSADESERAAAASIKALEYLATGDAEVLDEEFLRIIALADFNKAETIIALANALDANPELFDVFMQKLVNAKHAPQAAYENKTVQTPVKVKSSASDANNIAYANIASMLTDTKMAGELFERSTSLQQKTSEKTANLLAQKNSAIAGVYLDKAPQKATSDMADVFLASQNVSQLLNTYTTPGKKIPKHVAEKLVADKQYKALVDNYEKVGFLLRLFSFIPSVKKLRQAREEKKNALTAKLTEALSSKTEAVQPNVQEPTNNPVSLAEFAASPAAKLAQPSADQVSDGFSPVKPFTKDADGFSPVRPQQSIDDNGFSPLKTPIISDDGFSPVKLKSQSKVNDGFSPVRLKSESKGDDGFSPVRLKSQSEGDDGFSPVRLKSQSKNDGFSSVKANSQSIDDNGFSPLKATASLDTDGFSPVTAKTESDGFSPINNAVSLPFVYKHPANIMQPPKNVPPPQVLARSLMDAFNNVEVETPSLRNI